MRSEEALEACSQSWGARLKESDARLDEAEVKLAAVLSQNNLLLSQCETAESRIKEMESRLREVTLERDEAVRVQKGVEEGLNSKAVDLEGKIEMLLSQALDQREAFQFELQRVVLHAETRHQEILQSSIADARKEAEAEIDMLRNELASTKDELEAMRGSISALEDQVELQLSELTCTKKEAGGVKALEEELSASKVDLNLNLDRMACLETELSSLKALHKDLQEQLSLITAECTESQAMLKKMEERAEVAVQALTLERHSLELDLNSKLELAVIRVAELESERENAAGALTKSKAEVERLLLLVGSLGCELEEKELELTMIESARVKIEVEAREEAEKRQAQLSVTRDELNQCLEKISCLQVALEVRDKEIESLSFTSRDSSSHNSELLGEIERYRSSIEELYRQLAERGGQCDELEALVGELEASCDVQGVRVVDLETMLDHLKSDLTSKEETLGEVKSLLSAKEMELGRLKRDLAVGEAEMARIRRDLDRSLQERAAMVDKRKEPAPTNEDLPNPPLQLPSSQPGLHHHSNRPHTAAPPPLGPSSHPRPHSPSSAENAFKALNDLEAQLLPLTQGAKIPSMMTNGAKIPSMMTNRPPLMDVTERNAVSRVLSASRNVDLVALASASPDVAAMKRSGRVVRMTQGKEPGSSYFGPHDQGLGQQNRMLGRMTDTVRASVGDHETNDEGGGGRMGYASRSARVSLADLGSLAHHR